jgi:hypothetical protein
MAACFALPESAEPAGPALFVRPAVCEVDKKA